MRRRALTIVLFLLGGAVVNVAVAWGCATWSSLRYFSGPVVVDRPTEPEQRWWRAAAPSGAALLGTAVWRGRGIGYDALVIVGDRSGDAVFMEHQGGQVTINANVNSMMDRTSAVRGGWPWRSLGGERWDLEITFATPLPLPGHPIPTWRDADLLVDAWSFTRPAVLGGSSLRILPLRPLWPGFLVDTLFHSVLLWLLVRGPSAVRRFLRIRRGLCPACAYPMGVSEACSECGRALPRRAKAAT